MRDNTANPGTDRNPSQGTGAWRKGNGGSRELERNRGLVTRGGNWNTGLSGRGSTLPYGSPFTLMRRMAEDMDRIFDDFGVAPASWPAYSSLEPSGPAPSAILAGLSPAVEVFRAGDRIIVRADLPGLKKEDVTLEVENDVLTISGHRSEDHQENRQNYFLSERSYGAFTRSIPLPEGTDAEHSGASFKDGVLEVTFKAPAGLATHRTNIPIK